MVFRFIWDASKNANIQALPPDILIIRVSRAGVKPRTALKRSIQVMLMIRQA